MTDDEATLDVERERENSEKYRSVVLTPGGWVTKGDTEGENTSFSSSVIFRSRSVKREFHTCKHTVSPDEEGMADASPAERLRLIFITDLIRKVKFDFQIFTTARPASSPGKTKGPSGRGRP